MTNSHSRSFFGQNTGLILKSTSRKDDFIFLQCLKKKEGGVWEKPSKGEGKVIKMSLEEIVMILKVLRGEHDSWSTYHRYKDSRTQISFNWQKDVIWVNINNYSKMLDLAQIEIIKLLLKHLLQEKIEFATIYESDTQNILRVEEEVIQSETTGKNHKSKNNTKTDKEAKDVISINAVVQRATQKAILLQFQNGQEVWIPKSTIHNEIYEQKGVSQSFLIDTWVLENNNIQYENE